MSREPYAVPSSPHVLLVEDDALLRRSLADWLGILGMTVSLAEEGGQALALLDALTPDVVLSDVRMPGISGLELLAAIQKRDPALPVVLVTGHGDVPLAVSAMRQGAHDFVTKPYDPDHLAAILTRAVRQRRLHAEVEQLRRTVEGDRLESRLVGASPEMVTLRETIRTLARLPSDVLVYGETGTGKEIVAQSLHALGANSKGPFIALNCAAIPADLAESELFGHEEGAFTGARGARAGKIEAAQGGTLFLDEIESMPPPLQAKLLRVLQDRQVERLGGHRLRAVAFRVVAAAKEDLQAASAAGRFRSDLYFRLSGAEITLPPLRARQGDALSLFVLFAAQAAEAQGLARRALGEADQDAILAYGWPGNVRELKAMAERFAFGLLDRQGGLAGLLFREEAGSAGPGLAARMADFERRLIEAALAAHGGSVSAAADALRVPRRTLADRMARLGVA